MYRLEAHAGFFTLLMEGIFDPYMLYPFDKKQISELVTCVRTRDHMVCIAINSLNFCTIGFNERLKWIQ